MLGLSWTDRAPSQNCETEFISDLLLESSKDLVGFWSMFDIKWVYLEFSFHQRVSHSSLLSFYLNKTFLYSFV